MPDSVFIALARKLEPQMNTMKLQPSGCIFQVYSKTYDEGSYFSNYHSVGLQTEKYTGAFISAGEYDRMILSTTMFSDHVPLLYEQVVTALAPGKTSTAKALHLEPSSAGLPDTSLSDEEVDSFLQSLIQ